VKTVTSEVAAAAAAAATAAEEHRGDYVRGQRRKIRAARQRETMKERISSSSSRVGSSSSWFVVVLSYCALTSAGFVGSIYLLVPQRVRSLDRDDPSHIKWRTAATIVVSVVSTLSCKYLFFNDEARNAAAVASGVVSSSSSYDSITDTIRSCGSVVAHTALLYLGPIVAQIVRVKIHLDQQQANNNSNNKKQDDKDDKGPLCIWNYYYLSTFAKTYYRAYLERPLKALVPSSVGGKSVDDEKTRWIVLRNLVVAPVTEEIVFRGCIATALETLTTPSSTTTSTFHLSRESIVFVAPLFFGAAHLHHAYLRIFRHGEPWKVVAARTTFQFLYTSVFGAYATRAYLCTRSVTAVALSHALCNGMGLPDLSFFLQKSSPLYEHRNFLLVCHVLGMVGFFATMNWIIPLSSMSHDATTGLRKKSD